MRSFRVVSALLASCALGVGCTAILGDFTLGSATGETDGGHQADVVIGEGDGGLPLIDGGPGADAAECTTGAKECVANKLRSCVDGRWQSAPCTEDKPVCNAGACVVPPSCANLLGGCGSAPNNAPCCNAPTVTGGTFNRWNKAALGATVSNVRLNRFEVTVARFRTFIAAGQGTSAAPPRPGSGAHPKVPDSGWQASFNSQLLPTTATLTAAVTDCAGFPNATYAPAGVISSNNLPMNCVTAFEAFAFCAWDGGRLPTIAELERATRGTSQRAFPWGAQAIDSTRMFYCSSKDAGAGPCSAPDTQGGMLPVGSRNPGIGEFGHLDLFGSMREYTLDLWTPLANPCTDCVQLDASATSRGTLGGSWSDNVDQWPLIYNASSTTSTNPRTSATGFRCAYDL